MPNTGAHPSSPSPLSGPGAWSLPLSLVSPLLQKGPGGDGLGWARTRFPPQEASGHGSAKVPSIRLSVSPGDSGLGVEWPCLCPVTWGGLCVENQMPPRSHGGGWWLGVGGDGYWFLPHWGPFPGTLVPTSLDPGVLCCFPSSPGLVRPPRLPRQG